MLEKTFDYVLIRDRGLFTFGQFQQLPLREQAKIVLNKSAEFFCEGDPLLKKEVLGNKVKPEGL